MALHILSCLTGWTSTFFRRRKCLWMMKAAHKRDDRRNTDNLPASCFLILLKASPQDRSAGICVGRFQNTYLKDLGMSWEETSKSVNEKATFMWYLPALKSENYNTCGLKTKYRQISSFALLTIPSATAVKERLSTWDMN